MEHTNAEAMKCVHGLIQIERWMKGESMHCTSFMALAVVVAHNFFMNGVDRMDQLRSVNPMIRRGSVCPSSFGLVTWHVTMPYVF